MAVTAIALIGWQQSWFLYAALLLVVAIPLQMMLVGYEPRRATFTDEDASEPGADRATMLRDKRFYMVLPLYLAPPFFLTGLFFHQVQMAAARGWAIETLAAAFTLYAFIKVASSLVTGPLVDRFTALRLLPFSVIPLVAAFWLLTLPDNLFGAATPFIYMGLIGLNLGMVGPISGGLWPELFGTAHLGAIRSLTAPIVIAATAAAPVLFGLAVDMNISFSAIGLSGIIFLIGSALLAFSVPADKLATK